MFKLLLKLMFYKMFRFLGFPRIRPLSYTISLSYKCNAKCLTCNAHKRNSNDLTQEEWKRVFKSLGKSPYWVTFSGGEPFLLNNLTQTVIDFYDKCKPEIINIPTNGILTEKIITDVTNISKYCKKSKIMINISIDAIEEQHDNIRNVKNCYQSALKTFKELKKLERDNLSVGIHTVISKFNVENFASIANTLMNHEPDQYITEIAEKRLELHTMKLDITPSLINYKSAVDYLTHRIKQSKPKNKMNRITQAFRIEYYDLVKRILKDDEQVLPCYAGFASAQISPEGDVWSCCIKAQSMGNLKSNNYNFKKVWKNAQFKKERKSIKNKECYCPLANAAYTNMLMNIPTLYRVYKRSYVKWS